MISADFLFLSLDKDDRKTSGGFPRATMEKVISLFLAGQDVFG